MSRKSGSNSLAKLMRYCMQGASLAAVVTGVVILATSAPETIVRLKHFPPGYLLALAGLLAGMWICNSARTWLLARAMGYPIKYTDSLGISVSTDFGVAATPGGIGSQPIRLGLLNRAGLPPPVSGSIVTIDLFLDWAFFALLIPFAVYVGIRDPFWFSLLKSGKIAAALLVVGGLLALLTLLILLVRGKGLKRGLHALGQTSLGQKHRIRGRWRYWRREIRQHVRDGWSEVKALFGRRKLVVLSDFVLACLQWTCRYMILPVLLLAFSTHQNPLPLFVLQGVLFGVSLLFVVPGGGGSVEILSLLILPHFVSKSIVGVVILLWRFFTYYMCLLVGGAVFMWKIRHLGKGGGQLVDSIANAAERKENG